MLWTHLLWTNTGWSNKNGATLHFAEYLENYQRYLYDFLHTPRPVYIDHVYNVRLHSFYYLKWRHLLNRLPLDNATLKLQHHGVGRRLAYRKDKRCVSGMRGQGQQSVLVMRRFLAKGLKAYCQCHISVQDAVTTVERCSKTARHLTPVTPPAIMAITRNTANLTDHHAVNSMRET